MRKSDSGVVIRMSGGRFASRARSAGGVSPVRMPMVTSAASRPSRVASRSMPISGLRRLRSTSTASALSGDTYRTRQRRSRSAGTGSCMSRSIACRKAARVLPLPVGATTRVSSPVRDGRPRADLGWRRRGERPGEPGPGGGRERLQARVAHAAPPAAVARADASTSRTKPTSSTMPIRPGLLDGSASSIDRSDEPGERGDEEQAGRQAPPRRETESGRQAGPGERARRPSEARIGALADERLHVEGRSARAGARPPPSAPRRGPARPASGGGARVEPPAATAHVTGTMAAHSTMKTASLTRARSSRRRAKAMLTVNRAA